MITDYASLQTQVIAHAMREGDTEFENTVPTFIQLAEARLKRDSRVRQEFVVDPLAFDGEKINLPTDLKSITSLTLTGPTYFGHLSHVSMNSLETLKASEGDAAGVPKVFAVVGSDIYVHPTPGETYSGRLVYERTLTSLSDTNDNNWVLTNHPDVYLYATLVETAPFLKDDTRIPVWESGLQSRLEEIHQRRQALDMTSQVPGTLYNGIVFGG